MINFREHDRSDIPHRVKWLNNQKATFFAVDDPSHIVTEEEQSKWFNDYERNPAKKFFTILDNDKPIGFMGLSHIDNNEGSAEVFILIGEDEYRGKGIGKLATRYLINNAFEETNLSGLTLQVNKQNIPAIRLYESLGFQKTGESETEINMQLLR